MEHPDTQAKGHSRYKKGTSGYNNKCSMNTVKKPLTDDGVYSRV